VVEAAVVAHPDAVLGEKVHAFVTPRNPELTADVLRDYCAQRLADYKIPDYVTLDDQPLPRNANGKLQKSVLRQRIGS
jgi:non-ribosomal peptide synthetase component E (peptide arylation enzyme)